MRSIIEEQIDDIIEEYDVYQGNADELEFVKEILYRSMDNCDSVSLDEFYKIYSSRLFNYNSMQRDIKITKRIVLKGIYIFYNSTKNTYYIGSSTDILKSIDGFFNGYENYTFYENWQDDDCISINIILFDPDIYSNLGQMVHGYSEVFEHKIDKENAARVEERKAKLIQLDAELKEKERELQKELENIKRKDRIAEEKKKARVRFFKRHKGIICGISIFILLCVGTFFAYKEYNNYYVIGYDSNELMNVDYKKVNDKLSLRGFKNVYLEPLYDLDAKNSKNIGKVDKVLIGVLDSFDKDKKIRFDDEIIVQYHSLKEVYCPFTNADMKGQDYLLVENYFISNGFQNVDTEGLRDLKLGWFEKEGAVESVEINGKTDYEEGSIYRVDADVVIKYHSFKR